MSGGQVALARARAVIGVRFRLHGRDPASGLDCVGLAGHALGIDALPSGYPLRMRGPEQALIVIRGLPLGQGEGGAGDLLLLLNGGAGQLHFAIANGVGSACGAVHADLAMRRVVERPGPLPWPIIGRWHRMDKMEN